MLTNGSYLITRGMSMDIGLSLIGTNSKNSYLDEERYSSCFKRGYTTRQQYKDVSNVIMSGRLLTILATFLHGNGKTPAESFLEDIHLSVNLFTFSTLDDHSLATPREAPQSFSAAPSLPLERVEPRDPKATNHDLLKQIQVAHGASRPQIRQFATYLLREKEELYASEIPISEPNRDIPRLMLLWAYGDGSLGYHVRELPEALLVRHAEIDLEFQDFLICKGPLLGERRKQQR